MTADEGRELSQSEARLRLINLVSDAYRNYLATYGLTWGNLNDERDRAVTLGVRVIELVAKVESLKPVDDITLAELEHEQWETRTMLRDLEHADYILQDDGEHYQPVFPLEDLKGLIVRRARKLNMSWRDIGDTMDITSQGMQKRARENGWLDPPSID